MRNFLVKVHLYIAAFFAPILLVMATSGGLYLIGTKGQVTTTPVTLTEFSMIEGTPEEQVAALLEANDIDHEFEYIKLSGSTLITRPTSTTWYEVNTGGPQPVVTRNDPDLVKQLVELHKGHGPLLFKDLQKVMAVGLLLVLLTGLGLGLTSPTLRLQTAGIAGLGLVIFVLLAFAG